MLLKKSNLLAVMSCVMMLAVAQGDSGTDVGGNHRFFNDAVSNAAMLGELGKLRTGEGVGREAAVTAVGLSHGERDAFAGADGSLPLPSAPWSDVRPVNAAGLLDTSLKMFGTEPICFWTVSRIGREASGASSMVAGVGMRDIVFSFFG